jgi:hypothetical protein
MTSLRNSIATLRIEQLNAARGLNVSDVVKFLQVEPERPVSLRNLVSRIAALPESVPFHANIVTGAALGGEVSLTLNRNGSYHFSGFMRATGIPSFQFRIGVVVRSKSGQITVATQQSGSVFGSDTPGKHRQTNWDEVITDPKKTQPIRQLWPDISGGNLVVSRSSELSGVLGTAVDIVKDVAEFLLVAETLGGSLAICLVIGAELGDAGANVPGLGGVVGLGIIAGAVFIWGPLAIGPAFLIGVAAGEIVDALIKIRRLRKDEEDFARQVFGDSLDFDRIRLTNLLGIGNAPFTAPTVDDHILVNIGLSDAFYNNPTSVPCPNKNYPVLGQLLIHELTHAWQIEHAPLEKGYVPGFVCRGINEQVFVGRSSYAYGPPNASWGSFYQESQAHIVDDWFAGTRPRDLLPDGTRPKGLRRAMDPNDDYFVYIDKNIQPGKA